MLKRTTFATLGFAVLLTMAPLTPTFAQPQAGAGTEGSVVEATGQKSRGAGADENIKSTSVENDPSPESAPKAPPGKGGEQTRDAFCFFAVDNRTPWKIQIFVDGNYVGLVSPWGDSTGIYPAGPLTVYGVADFTDRRMRLTWGPQVAACTGPYTWRLK